MKNKARIADELRQLRRERNAIILAHVYQRPEIQDIADHVGDSLDLSKKAVHTDADVIVFCGVRFMAETAAILNPGKTVLLPDINAGCALANMAAEYQLREMKARYPDAIVVSYVNSSAAVKAESDICCTSANAVAVVNSLPDHPIIFVPDRNLGSYVAERTRRRVIRWNGYCYVHEHITTDHLMSLKKEHPNAEIIVHPECSTSVRRMADFIGSTGQMSSYAASSPQTEFIVGTEANFSYRLRRDNPDKDFHTVPSVCSGMNEITLEKTVSALERLQYRVQVPERIRQKAEAALIPMLMTRVQDDPELDPGIPQSGSQIIRPIPEKSHG
jgi:quinolinate synthase